MSSAENAHQPPRPGVSVVVPIGSADGLGDLIASLSALQRIPDDELILVDNTSEGVLLERTMSPAITVVRADRERSSYHARNVGAENARNPWLLFMDADCRPLAALLDEYFASPIAEDCGALAGEVVGVSGQSSVTARYASARHHLRQGDSVRRAKQPFAVTANLLVRRSAWSSVGGFCEGIRSGGDVDFSWRLQDAGWMLDYQSRALVQHVHRESARALARQWMAYGASAAWMSRRYAHARQKIPRRFTNAGRSAAKAAVLAAVGHFEQAQFSAFDVLIQLAFVTGWFHGNRADPLHVDGPARRALLADEYPNTRAYRDAHSVPMAGLRVEAKKRPHVPNARLIRPQHVYYAEDEGMLMRLTATLRLVARRPLRTARGIVLHRDSSEPFSKLAPSVLRLIRHGPPDVICVDPSRADDAARLAEVLGSSQLRFLSGHGA